MSRVGLISALVICCTAISPAYADWNTQIHAPHQHVATLDSTNVQESSGLLASRINADVLWTHNDSGSSGPRVWGVRLNASDAAAGVARDLGYVELTGASNVDWEDISAGPRNTIYVFDGGDNPPCDRTDKRIHRFREPVIDPAGPRVKLSVPCESIRFEYPDSLNPTGPAITNADRYDAECLMVHPTTGDIYIVTKRSTKDVGVARVFKLPADRIRWNSPAVHVLRHVTDLTQKLGVAASVVTTVTAGDIDAEGRRVLIRRYGFTFEFTLPNGQPFETIFDQKPTSLEMAGEVQGEGICYSRDGRDIYSSSEVRLVGGIPIGPTKCPIYVTSWLLANVAAEPSASATTVRWDTRQDLNSQVDFGKTAEYGQKVADPATVDSHLVQIKGIQRATRYFYRVTSGPLTFPPPTQATDWSFTSPD